MSGLALSLKLQLTFVKIVVKLLCNSNYFKASSTHSYKLSNASKQQQLSQL